MPLDIERLIDPTDPVYTFNEVMEHVDLGKYVVQEGTHKKGRRGYDPVMLMKVILFAFMEHGYASFREIEKYCKTDIRFMWLLDGGKPPSFMTLDNFARHHLQGSIVDILTDINHYIFTRRDVDTDRVYIDGTKIEASSNKYTWVWKKSCIKNRNKVFGKITRLVHEMNGTMSSQGREPLGERDEYTVEYAKWMLEEFRTANGISTDSFVHGRGKRKTPLQRLYESLESCIERLERYAEQIGICGQGRNSYSKTDHDATFMRVKKDYMRNDRLLPAYNLQIAVTGGYVASYGVYPYASDTDCFMPMMEKYRKQYAKYPLYPTADAGYGSYNNYLYCEKHGMGKYQKFTMYEKEKKDRAYREDPYRAVNFMTDEEGRMVCPAGRRFIFIGKKAVRGNMYGRTEEYYRCEDCTDCCQRGKCHRGKGDRTVRLNAELSVFHKEVIENFSTGFGKKLLADRSIQAEGMFGLIKWNRSYTRVRRRGLPGVSLELGLVCCGANIHKYHLSSAALKAAA